MCREHDRRPPPHGSATGIFDVYSGANAEPYVVDLAGENDRCACPDVQHNLEDGERCKHARRVRLEFGLAPFEDVPAGIRAEHSAPTDVELARKRRGIDMDVEPEPEPITVGDAKPERAVAMTDGGVVLEPEPHPESVENADAGAGCPYDHPDCEGADAARDRPELCWECWKVWAAQ